MFDQIRFFITDTAVSHDTILTATRGIELSFHQDFDMFSPAVVQAKNRFYIDGKIRLLFPYPISEKAKTSYFYPQLFSYIDSGPDYFTLRRDYDSYELVYTYKGTGKLRYSGKEYTLKAGDGFWIDCRLPHEYRTMGKYWSHADFHFNGPACSSLYESFTENSHFIFHEDLNGPYQSLLENVLRVWDQVIVCRDLQVSNTIGELLAHLITTKSAINELKNASVIADLARIIQTDFRKDLTIDWMAQKTFMSKSYLSREFRKYFGMAPGSYLLYVRIENAKQLLLSCNLPINDISKAVGFTDINSFTRQFKKRAGVTPREFRKASQMQVETSEF